MPSFSVDLNKEGVVSKLVGIVFSLVVWAGFYKVQEFIFPLKTPEWRCRIVSLTHGLLVTLLAYYSQFIEGPSIFGIEPGLPNNNTQMFIVKVCLGYFFFDVTWCLYYQTEPSIMIVHHVLSIFGMVNMVFHCKWGTELIGVIGGTEISNPLLQLRWFLKDSGYSKTLLGEVVDFLFITVFGVFRLGLGGYVMVSYISYPNSDILGKIGSLTMFGIGVIFYYYILRYAVRKYSKMYYSGGAAVSTSIQLNGNTSLTNGKHLESNAGDGKIVYNVVSNGHTKAE